MKEDKQEVMLSIGDELKRARAIADIDSDSFVQQDFRSNAVTNISLPGETEEKFEFGTSAETGLESKKTEQEESIFHPALFGDQSLREKRFLQHVFTIRQRAIHAMAASQ